MWHVGVKGNVTTTYDWKVNSGANAIVKRESIRPQVGSPSYFQCNVSIPSLPAGRQRLYFLPERVLVWDAHGVGAISYEQVEVYVREQRFIEDGSVPSDTKIVDKTWKYVNKKGGPDRRFNNNRELPVALYEEILLKSSSGLQELFQASKLGAGEQLNTAIKKMSLAITKLEDVVIENGYEKTLEPSVKTPVRSHRLRKTPIRLQLE